MSAYTKSEIEAMTIEEIQFHLNYPDLEFAIRQTQHCDNVLVFRSSNALFVRMLAVRVNAVLMSTVSNYASYPAKAVKQQDGRWFSVIPLKTNKKSNIAIAIVDRVVTGLVAKLGAVCHAEVTDGVEPNSPWSQGSDLSVVVEVVDEIPVEAIAIALPKELPGKQATVAQLKKYLRVKSGTKSELLAQL